ncbi:uncharacterized protein LOC125782565 [Astyanax mexicanus]|uniref:uncharacterized protein LOC125782565 n=1 Tax=Astyanax mexicanus TaxID=7994 RepID=UPI0020CB4071|nr:uncharacterized protein LOC125782565 [Astyanax mexicanus]
MEGEGTTSSRSLHTRSRVSRSSRHTQGSTTSRVAAMARAEAEAAKALMAFSEKEIDMKVQKAHLEASLDALSLKKSAAAATAKAEALEAALRMDDDLSQKLDSQLELEPQNPMQRTGEYVQKYSLSNSSIKMESDLNVSHTHEPQTDKMLIQDPPASSITKREPSDIRPTIGLTPSVGRQETYEQACPSLHGRGSGIKDEQYSGLQDQHEACSVHQYPPIRPPDRNYQAHLQQGQQLQDQSMINIMKFMARREIVTTGLLQFDDRPENYRAWRASFVNTVGELSVTEKEELDLLVKWLGRQSAEQVKRIRAVHVNNPKKGLQMAWERLNQCYGAPEVIEESLWKRIDSFDRISNKDHQRLRELGDLLMELQAAKEEGAFPGLAYLDTARGISGIVQKLPFALQEKWMAQGSKYKDEHNTPFPPFSFFVTFVCQQAKMRNDPSFSLAPLIADTTRVERRFSRDGKSRAPISVHKMDVAADPIPPVHAVRTKIVDPSKICPIHNRPHPLHKCRGFREKTLEDRRTFLKQNGICYRCCGSISHLARDCDKIVKCTECNSERHIAALHPGPVLQPTKSSSPVTVHGGEEDTGSSDSVTATCTEVCGEDSSERSCSKICLVKVFPTGQKEKAIKLYTIIDDQSNRSLVKSSFFDIFGIKRCHQSSYTLKTCAGTVSTSGRQASGFQIESMDGQVSIPLPTLIECDDIPNDRTEIPTPEAAFHHKHLNSLAEQIPELDPDAPILMLLGRDIIRIHKVHEQINGPHDAPFAQKLDLGWVIVGNICLGGVKKSETISTLFTHTLENGRRTVFKPCPNHYLIKEKYDDMASSNIHSQLQSEVENSLGHVTFKRTKDDERIAPSVEDRMFLDLMQRGFYRDTDNSWVAPLPFKPQRLRLPNNRAQVWNRFTSLQRSFKSKPQMKDQFFTFMGKVFECGHAELAPPLTKDEECWYLPIFVVYHPRKPSQIRVVFDSSARWDGVSLNDVLLKGPDLNNSLLAVLIRFRKDAVAFMADIQQMFHCFIVRPEDRNFLRFFWFQDNNPNNQIVECRMRVHVFGNSPSPAVAIYGLRHAAQEEESEFGTDAKKFVERDFYVDDAVKSVPTARVAVDLLKRTQEMLACSNLRLHKIVSPNREVMEAFPVEDHASDLKNLDFSVDSLPVQRSLGVSWNLKNDTFTFQVSSEKKPFTRRGILSTINSLYDPLGFAAPVLIQGKILLRDLASHAEDWDAPLPPERKQAWDTWRDRQ